MSRTHRADPLPRSAYSTTDGETLALVNGGSATVLIGSPVASWGAGACRRAVNTSLALAQVAGLATATTAVALPVPLASSGRAIALTPSQWDAVTGQSGGLTHGAEYFVGATPGSLSTTAPTLVGRIVAPIGRALSSTVFLLEIATPVQL